MFRTLILLLLLTLWASADDLSPSNGAHLLSSDPTVVFRWPGKSKQTFRLQVYGSGKEMFSGDIKGNSHSLKLRPGLRYQWKVSRRAKGGYFPLVRDASFQLSDQLDIRFEGKAGKAGGPPRDYSANQPNRAGTSDPLKGRAGEPGSRGLDLRIKLQKKGDYIALEIQGPPAIVRYLLLPSTRPVRIATVGGSGGAGGQGRPGKNGFFRHVSGTRYIFTGSAGGNGGAGGDGGPGGRVTVTSRGVDAQRYLEVSSVGGEGGPGGAGGRAPHSTRMETGPRPTRPLRKPGAGRTGRSGRPGASEQVIWR